MLGRLPTTLTVAEKEYPISTDFRQMLTVLEAMEDPDLEDKEKAYLLLLAVYKDLENIPQEHLQEAYEQASFFLDGGTIPKSQEISPRKTVDWTQDESLIFPAINRIAGFETRLADYVHWWTFLGYFKEINDGVYAQVLQLRAKKARGKKLEKHEEEWWRSNRNICEIKKRYSQEEINEQEILKKMFT